MENLDENKACEAKDYIALFGGEIPDIKIKNNYISNALGPSFSQ